MYICINNIALVALVLAVTAVVAAAAALLIKHRAAMTMMTKKMSKKITGRKNLKN